MGEEYSRTFPLRTGYHTKISGNQSADMSFREISSGDIAVFQHTPKASYIDLNETKCTGEEHSRTLPWRTSPPF